MPLGQALVIALGLALAMFGYLYVVSRSQGSDPTATALSVLFDSLSVSLLVGLGTGSLLVREPNALIGAGIAAGFYAAAFRRGFTGWHLRGEAAPSPALKRAFQVYFIGNVVAGLLSGVGGLSYGGALGLLGALAALCWTALHAWLLKRVTWETIPPSVGPRHESGQER